MICLKQVLFCNFIVFYFCQNLFEISEIIFLLDNRFGDIYNMTDILNLRTNNSDFNELISLYRKRIPSWMALYTRGQCAIDHDLNSIYLLTLSPGDIFPLHGIYNFPINHIEHESHDLISILSIQPEHYQSSKNSYNQDGIHIFDPRGTVSGYGFANVFIHTSQHEKLSTVGGYLHIFPSGIKINLLPVDYTRVFIVSFAKLYSVHQNYRIKNENDEENDSNQDENNNDNIPVYHLNDNTKNIKYFSKNDEPFFDQNIMLFSTFGTPIFHSSLITNNKNSNPISLSIPSVPITMDTFNILSQCFLSYSLQHKSVHKSNRGGWQSKSNLFFGLLENDKRPECQENMSILYDYLCEQIAIWVLSFSNSYYFDDNGLVINFENIGSKIYIDITSSWININRGNDMNMPHTHPNSDLSGIVFIDMPSDIQNDIDGSIYFDDPRSNLFDNNMHLPFAQFNEPLNIIPKIGDVLLFPGWLRHWTIPTYSNDRLRISVAFNVKFEGVSFENQKKKKKMDKKFKQNSDSITFMKKNL